MAIILGLVTGVAGITLSTALFLKLLNLGQTISLAMLPKSVTIPVAVGISQITGANPSLTIAFVLVTGNVGTLIIALPQSLFPSWPAYSSLSLQCFIP